MFSLFKRTVETKVTAVHLDPSAAYMIVVGRDVTKAELANLIKQVKQVGVKKVVGFMLESPDAIQAIDRPKTTKRDSNGRFAKKGK